MRLTGKLCQWHNEKAFGFITLKGGGDDVFIHKTAFCTRKRTPQINDVITFSITKDIQGRYCAEQATYSGEKLTKKQPAGVNKFSIYLATAFLSLIVIALIFDYLPITLVLVYICSSVITFIAYALDKSRAQRNARRTPESTLHLCALIGGWPGAAIAQQTLRHKSQKRRFRTGFWLTVIINCAALTWLLSANGTHLMAKLKQLDTLF